MFTKPSFNYSVIGLTLLLSSTSALAAPPMLGAINFKNTSALKCPPRYTPSELIQAVKQSKCSEGASRSFILIDIPGSLKEVTSLVARKLANNGIKTGPVFDFGKKRTEFKVEMSRLNKISKIYPPAVLLNPVRISLTPYDSKLVSITFESLASQLVHTPAYATGTQLDDKLISILGGIKGSIQSK